MLSLGNAATPLYEGLFDALPDPIVITMANGCVLALNRSARRQFGPDTGEQVNVKDLLPFVDPDAPADSPADAWVGQIADQTGQERDFEVVRRKIPGPGRARRYAYVLHDVSHYTELSRSREVLLHGAAHELRNPVTALGNVIDLLSEDAATLSAQEFKRLLDLAARTAERLSELTEGLLNAASIRTGNLQIVLDRCPLSVLVDLALDGVALMIDARSQQVEREPHAEIWVLADRRFGPRVLANLLTNASKYSPRGSTIRVKAHTSGDEVIVSVEDQGPGIAPEEIVGLFERYYRARPAHEEPGIGLGLAIAKGIVEAHGGRIGVTSEVGKGTTVWFTLRAADPSTRD